MTGELRVRATLTSSQRLVDDSELEKLHFAATVVLAPAADDSPPGDIVAAVRTGDRLDKTTIYSVFFHGPAYQVLGEVARTETGLAGELATGLPADSASAASWLFAPRLVELCFQTAGVWEIGATGKLGLPAAVDSVRVWELPATAALVAEVAAPQSDADGLRFDAIVRDQDGRVYVEVKGYRTAALPGDITDAARAGFRTVVGG